MNDINLIKGMNSESILKEETCILDVQVVFYSLRLVFVTQKRKKYFKAFVIQLQFMKWLENSFSLVWFDLVWCGSVLWHINLCRLFNAKSIFM